VNIDVVIVNFHSAPLIGRAIATARAFVGTAARVIVVDNSPGDGAADVVRAAAPGAVVIANPVNRGFATAVNQAIAAGEGEIVVLVNPDVQEISGTSTDVMSAFRDARVGAVATRLLNADGTIQPNCFRAPQPFDVISEEVALAQRFPSWRRPRRFRMLDCDHDEAQEVDWAAGACLFLRRAALAEVGQFDERFFVYYEETDWLVRAKQHGWRTLYLPSVTAMHASASSSPGVDSRPSLLLLESQHRYARKHFGAVAAALLRISLLGIDTARLISYAAGGPADARRRTLDRIRVHVTMRAPRPP
jgi:GT2 family glycosyltransferase